MHRFFYLIMIVIVQPSFAQDSTIIESVIPVTERDFYTNLLDKELTYVLTGNSTIGTNASLSTKDDVATFSGHIRIGEFSNLNITAKGGATEGVVQLINGGKTSPNISIGATLNKGIYQRTHTSYMDATQALSFMQKANELYRVADKSNQELDILKEKLKMELETKKLSKDKKNIDLAKANALVITPRATPELTKYSTDSLEQEKRKFEYEIKQLSIEIRDIEDQYNSLTQQEIDVRKQVVDEKMVADYKKEREKIHLTGYDLRWMSYGLKLNNRSFKSFADSLPFGDQITKQTYNNVEFQISRTRYNVNPYKRFASIYQSYGMSLSYEDNFSDLTAIELKDVQSIPDSVIDRSITSKQKVYTGEYLKDQVFYTLFYDLYWFLNKNQTFAFHFNAALRDNSNRKDEKLNITTGILFGFQNKDNDKEIINVELFYNMRNVFGEYKEDEKFVDRTNWGLSFNIPMHIRR